MAERTRDHDTQHAVLDALQQHGPHTRAQLQQRLGRTLGAIGAAIAKLHASHRVHVCGIESDANHHRGRRAPVYSAGAAADVAPARTPLKPVLAPAPPLPLHHQAIRALAANDAFCALHRLGARA